MPEKKKVKKGKPVQTKAWSQKEDAEAKKEARRLKKVKKAKAVNGKILEAREDDGEGEDDWKEQVREQKEARRRQKEAEHAGSGKVAMSGLEL